MDHITRRAHKPIYTNKSYNNYEYCAATLKKGIEVIKHHYSKQGSSRILLKLSDDEKCLTYKKVKPKNKLISFLRGERQINFNDIACVIYGPTSSTFAERKHRVVKSMVRHQEINLSVSTRQNYIDSLGVAELEESSLSESEDDLDALSHLARANYASYRKKTMKSQNDRKFSNMTTG